MQDVLRLIEDLVPLIDVPVDKAVETLKQTFGAPKTKTSSEAQWPTAGLSISPGVKSGTTTISIYCDATDGFQPFKGALAESKPLPEDRRDVRDSLGDPSAARTNPRLSLNRLLGMAGMSKPQAEWDRYDNPDRVIHFEYDASRRVRRITLTSAPAIQE